MHRMNVSFWLGLGVAVTLGLLSVTAQQAVAARIAVADDVLVDLRAEDLKPGPVSEWPNRGSLGGVFTVVGTPQVVDVGGWESVSLDGDSYFEGPRSVPGIEGSSAHTIEVWVYKIGVAGEQTMVSWSHRGGPEGTNMAFNFAADPSWGALGHWGAGPDMGWGGDYAPTPPLDTWVYLAYTYDGSTSRLYVNGDPAGEENMTLNIHAGAIIRVGAQGDNTGENANTAMNFMGGIAQVRIQAGALTPEQIAQNAEIRIQSSETASNPSPGDGDTDVLRDADLNWRSGETAKTHQMYLGTAFDEVDSATVPTVSDLSDSSFNPGRLTFDTTYYWRVDEVNGTPDKTVFKGDVWSFTVEPYSIMVPVDVGKATASSTANESTPDMTVNGSGLANGAHSTDQSDMWLSATGDLSPWLMYELDRVQKLDKMLIWNGNSASESFIGWGIKDVNILYSLDGVTWTSLAESTISRAPGEPAYNEPQVIDFGSALAKYVKINILSNWGGFLKQYSVSEVQFYGLPVYARTPVPPDQAVDVMPDVVATWRAGREADTHRVMVSQDVNAVSEGLSVMSNTNSVDMSTMDLLLGETYYWQVAEVNDNMSPSQWTSDVWTLTTVNRVMVDDFESYTNFSPNRPFQTWLDGIGYSADEFFSVGFNGNGSGAAVGHDIWSPGSTHFDGDIMEKTLTAEGSGQSMPLYYSGNSQTDRTFATAQDWSLAGIKTLVLYFNGDRSNDPASLYVTLNGTRVDYPNSAAVSSGVWTPWHIDLTSVATDLSQVKTLSIGIDSTGSGVVYVDQISLYRDAPDVPVSSDPGTTGLAAQYSFENDYTDSSGHGLTGTPTGAPSFVDGLTGNGMALSFNGNDDYVDVPVGDIIASSTSMSIACWANFSNEGGAWQRLWDFGSGSNANPYMFMCPRSGTTGPTRFAIRSATVGEQIIEGPTTLSSGWQQVTVVIDGDAHTISMYINGSLVVQGATEVLPSDLGSTVQNYLGKSQWPDALYQGALDELLIYDRALSEGEIRYLAGDR